MSGLIRQFTAAAIAALATHAASVGAADPVKLVVGYQPYDTISYSAAVIRAQELWKKIMAEDVSRAPKWNPLDQRLRGNTRSGS